MEWSTGETPADDEAPCGPEDEADATALKALLATPDDDDDDPGTDTEGAELPSVDEAASETAEAAREDGGPLSAEALVEEPCGLALEPVWLNAETTLEDCDAADVPPVTEDAVDVPDGRPDEDTRVDEETPLDEEPDPALSASQAPSTQVSKRLQSWLLLHTVRH